MDRNSNYRGSVKSDIATNTTLIEGVNEIWASNPRFATPQNAERMVAVTGAIFGLINRYGDGDWLAALPEGLRHLVAGTDPFCLEPKGKSLAVLYGGTPVTTTGTHFAGDTSGAG